MCEAIFILIISHIPITWQISNPSFAIVNLPQAKYVCFAYRYYEQKSSCDFMHPILLSPASTD